MRPRRLVIFYLKCAAYKSTYLLTYLLTHMMHGQCDARPAITVPAYVATHCTYSRRDGQAELTWEASNMPTMSPIPALTGLDVEQLRRSRTARSRYCQPSPTCVSRQLNAPVSFYSQIWFLFMVILQWHFVVYQLLSLSHLLPPFHLCLLTGLP